MENIHFVIFIRNKFTYGKIINLKKFLIIFYDVNMTMPVIVGG